MPVTKPRVGLRAALKQWVVILVFFLPLWLVWAYLVSPRLKTGGDLLLYLGIPLGAFALAVLATFHLRARHRARHPVG